MSMEITDFWALMDFIIAQVVNFFTFVDSVVIIDSPRFTIFNFIISLIFLDLLINTINWLRGSTTSGGISRWQFITGKRQGQQSWEADLDRIQNDYVEVGSVGLPRDVHKELANQEQWNNSFRR